VHCYSASRLIVLVVVLITINQLVGPLTQLDDLKSLDQMSIQSYSIPFSLTAIIAQTQQRTVAFNNTYKKRNAKTKMLSYVLCWLASFFFKKNLVWFCICVRARVPWVSWCWLSSTRKSTINNTQNIPYMLRYPPPHSRV
jgi:hypothetical protein